MTASSRGRGRAGQPDTVIRPLQPRMSEHLGVPIVVENRPGAGGAIGAGVVAAAPPDGTTLFFDSFGFVVQPLIQRGLPFDSVTAFAPRSNDAVTAAAEDFAAVIRTDGGMVRRLVAETGIRLAG